MKIGAALAPEVQQRLASDAAHLGEDLGTRGGKNVRALMSRSNAEGRQSR
jgi:hypothetical protein